MKIALLIHTFSCFSMMGLIWVVQLVHYPAFLFVNPSQFSEFAPFHARRITWIVAPLMLVEVFTGAWLFQLSEGATSFTINLVLLFIIWLCTAILSIPSHNRLQRARDEKTIHWLIHTNWPRTLLWTARSVFLGTLVYHL